MKKKILILLYVSCLFILGCDPDKSELEKAKNIDLTRVKGKLTSKEIRQFNGDNDSSLRGQDYYCLTFAYQDEQGRNFSETYRGVPKEIFDSVELGHEFPLSPIKTLDKLKQVTGEIIDMFVNPIDYKYFIVVDEHENGIKTYQVSIEDYYRSLKIGKRFPEGL